MPEIHKVTKAREGKHPMKPGGLVPWWLLQLLPQSHTAVFAGDNTRNGDKAHYGQLLVKLSGLVPWWPLQLLPQSHTAVFAGDNTRNGEKPQSHKVTKSQSFKEYCEQRYVRDIAYV